jgi:hypothetical protein
LRTHGGQHHLCLQRRQILCALPGKRFTEDSLEPIDGLDPKVAQCVTAVGEHEQKSLVTVELGQASPGVILRAGTQ